MGTFIKLIKEKIIIFYKENIVKYDSSTYYQKKSDVEESIAKLLLLPEAEKKI